MTDMTRKTGGSPETTGPTAQDAALRRLHHEMTALFLMMPPAMPVSVAMLPIAAGPILRSDAEIEAQFDTMPV